MNPNTYFDKYEYISRHYYDDRLYSQIMRHFLSFFMAKILNKRHIHWNYHNTEINNYFNLLFDKSYIIDLEDTFSNINKLTNEKKLISMPDQNISKYFTVNQLFTEEHINLIKKAYKYNKHTDTFKINHSLNVAVHIRRGDIANRSYCDRYTPLDFFINNIKLINSLYPNAHIHIYSDSYLELPIKSKNLYYHYNDDIVDCVNDMIKSHILIMSVGSNVSYFAGLLNEGICFFDKSKLTKCFNNMYNIYWSEFKKFIYEEDMFINALQNLDSNN
jgi:hypothetical protein